VKTFWNHLKTVPNYYKDEDIKAGGIYTENRVEKMLFP
jgi:hypothetical protein